MSGIFDFTSGKFLFGNTDNNTFMDQDNGHMMIKTSDSTLMDMSTGEMHMTSSNGFDDGLISHNIIDDDDPFKMF